MNWFVKKTLSSVFVIATLWVAFRLFIQAKEPGLYIKNVLIYGSSILVLTVTAFGVYYYLRHLIPLRKEPGFPFVYVEFNGTVRELNEDEKTYLNTEFSPGDGGRPYIKSRYDQKSYGGSISGFIYRDRVPKAITIISELPQVNL